MELNENNGITKNMCPSFLQTQIQNNWSLSHFPIPLALRADRKHWMHFKNENAIFKFRRRSVEGVV